MDLIFLNLARMGPKLGAVDDYVVVEGYPQLHCAGIY